MIELDLTSFELVSSVENEAGDRRLLVLRRRDGLFQFATMRFWPAGEDDEGCELGWQGDDLSGLFSDAGEAELAARQKIRWLKNDNQS